MFKKIISKLFGIKDSSSQSPSKKSNNTSKSSNGVIQPGTKTGKVKFLNRTKGYGFIKSNQTDMDVFVHFDDAQDFLKRGDKVSFEVEKSDKGLRARNVQLVKA